MCIIWQLHIEKHMYYIGISFSVFSLMCLFKVYTFSYANFLKVKIYFVFWSTVYIFVVCLFVVLSKEEENTANYLHIKTSKYSFLCWSFPNHEQIFYCVFDAANFHFPYQAPWITHLFTNWFHGSPLCFLLDPVRAFVIEIRSLKK